MKGLPLVVPLLLLGGPTAYADKLTSDDLQTIAHYHAFNLYSIELGALAVRKTASEAVKAFGTMAVTEHAADDARLVTFAGARGQGIPAEKPGPVDAHIATSRRADLEKLTKLEGTDFDTAFVAIVIRDHESELAHIDARASRITSRELAEAVRARKQTFRQHANAARTLRVPTTTASR